MITGNTEVNKWRRVSAGSLTIRYTGYLTNPFSKLKSRRPPLYKVQTGQTRKHYFCQIPLGPSAASFLRPPADHFPPGAPGPPHLPAPRPPPERSLSICALKTERASPTLASTAVRVSLFSFPPLSVFSPFLSIY